MIRPQTLVLPNPGQEALEQTDEQLPRETAETISSQFGFPYPRAYDIQIQLMANIFKAIEENKIGVFESPTGTGKSLSLICSSFTWLRQNSQRAINGQLELESDNQEPDWVIQHHLEKKKTELKLQEDELYNRIQVARIHQAKMKRELGAGKLSHQDRKRTKQHVVEKDTESDQEFLASDTETPRHGLSSRQGMIHYSKKNTTTSIEADEDLHSNLSPQVKALMQQYETETRVASGSKHQEDQDPETLPRIIYSSRTHSQLSQFVAELRKTTFGKSIEIKHWTNPSSPAVVQDTLPEKSTEPIRTISLGSRKQMCINQDVQNIGIKRGVEAMNERCLELLKEKTKSSSTSSQKRCQFLPPLDESGRAQMLDFRDHAMTQVGDIEDLVDLGKSMNICPYFAARNGAKQAQLVTLPYNLLLQKDARNSLGISIKDCVILIDEAHNLIDTILSTYTVTISSVQIQQALDQIQTYLDRFALKLKGSNEQNLRQVKSILEGLRTFCSHWASTSSAGLKEQVITASELVQQMGGNLDQVNLIFLEQWLKDSQIARKVSGYADKVATRPATKTSKSTEVGKTNLQQKNGKTLPSKKEPVIETRSQSAISVMHLIESFLVSLANRTEDGRVVLKLMTDTIPTDSSTVVSLKYQLLNPSHVFQSLAEEARSVILVGGTMEPISDFRQQLLTFLPDDRFMTFSCGHIIPPSNLLVNVVSNGPRNIPFEFKYENRHDMKMLEELGNTLVNLCNLIPDGLVVFMPSYSFLDNAMERWKTFGILDRIGSKKKIFLEPKTTIQVEKTLRDYTLQIDQNRQQQRGGARGAILFAVVGAKLSEGINFSDHLARGVAMVGMPFANIKSPDLVERMQYVRQLYQKTSSTTTTTIDPGNELYINLCMKAVNQSIGRAIRHKDDYAVLFLLDQRYGRKEIRNRLPKWIRKQVHVSQRFGETVQKTAAFFRQRK